MKRNGAVALILQSHCADAQIQRTNLVRSGLRSVLVHTVESHGVELDAADVALDHVRARLRVDRDDDGLLHDDLFRVVQRVPAGLRVIDILAGRAVGDDRVILGVAPLAVVVGGIGDHICKDKEYEIVREAESREVRWLNY